jgi:putative flippase GtrA
MHIKKDLVMLNKFKSLKIFQSDTSFMQLLRTYIVGAINLIIGLTLIYIFQFWILTFIAFPLRTYVTNVSGFLIGVVISYFLSRRIIFKFSFFGGKLKEFLNFSYTNLISLFAPNIIWFIINFIDDTLQKDEVWFLVVTVLINGAILPIKYLIYKFFVFKDSL